MSDPTHSENKETSIPLDVAHWYRRVYALCQSKLISKADAEDATQETMLRGLGQVQQLRTKAALGAWLRGIAHNVCVDIIRKNTVRETSQDSSTVAITKTENDASETAELTAALNQLPEPLREVILLHYYEKRSYDEMAEWLGVARSTVNDRLRRARSQLKQIVVSDRSTL